MSKDNSLSSAQWLQVKQWFNQLIDSPQSQVDQFLASVTDDEKLIIKVRELLEVYHSSQDKTITPNESSGEALLRIQSLNEGDQFTKYSIQKLIGSGGMGQVYLAERRDEVTQHVAIKVLNQGRLDAQAMARFETERRILAELDHHNIARLIDAGTELGNPYYVMEYIDGIPIDIYCEAQNLNLTGRLNLFLKLCDAVTYAHNNLIVHRDLKPSNVLVTKDDEIKLLDFGIAKPLKILPGTEAVHETQVGTTALTPQYASPEQINGEAITVSCDIYVLGLLLYKLTTGQHAYELANKTWGEIERTINQDMPTLPSKAIQESNSHSIMNFELKGDLDAIISHALKKQPNERYSSVKDFAADIAHYLANEPIQIKRNQNWYRIGKHLRKHWLPIGAGAVFFLMMLFSSLFIWQQSKRIEVERDKALTEKEIAQTFSSILLQSFKNADPTKVLTNELKASQVLVETARLLKSEKYINNSAKPQVILPIMQTLNNIAEYQTAVDLFDSIAKVEFDNFPIDLQSKLVAEKGVALVSTGRVKEALIHINLPQYNAFHSDPHYLFGKGVISQEDRNYQNAEKIFSQLHNSINTKDVMYLKVCRQLGLSMNGNNRIDEVIKLLNRCLLNIEGSESVEQTWEVSNINIDISNKYYQKRDLEKAETLANEILDFRRKTFGKSHISLSPVYRILSSINFEQGNVEEATKYSMLNIMSLENQLGPNNIRLSIPYFNLGMQYDHNNLFSQAEEMILKAIDLTEEVDTEHPRLGFFYTGLGIMFLDAKKYQKSLDALLKAKSIDLLRYKEEGAKIARINVFMSIILKEFKEFDKAWALLEKSFDTYIKSSNNIPNEDKEFLLELYSSLKPENRSKLLTQIQD